MGSGSLAAMSVLELGYKDSMTIGRRVGFWVLALGSAISLEGGR